MHLPNVDLASPSLNLFYDMKEAPFFKQDQQNSINQLTVQQ
jgi:hypothetical protein